jgi:spermidine/putrescine transport system permease protein
MPTHLRMPSADATARPRRRRTIANDLLAGIPAIWLTVFFLAPLGLTTVFSFGHSTFGGAELGFTFENYSVAASGFYGAIFLRTLVFAIMASALCLAVAFPLAYFIARHTDQHRLVALALILIPYFSSFLIRVMSLQILMSRHGFAEVVVNLLHLLHGPLDLLDSQTAVFIGIVYAYLPIAVIPIFVVLDRIPKALIEASRDLGASHWQTFVSITLPLSRPGVATALLLTASPMIGEMVIPNLLGGGRGVLVGQAMSAQFLQSQNYPLGSAMAVLILITIAAIIGLLARMTKGFAETGR